MPLKLDTKQHLAYVAEHAEITQWNPGEISGICRAALAEIEGWESRVEELTKAGVRSPHVRIADALEELVGILRHIQENGVPGNASNR